jgi:hypothetical protein
MITLIRILAAVVSSFALFWAGLGAGLWWDRRPAGDPSFSFRVLFWPVKLSAPNSLQVTTYARGRADQLAQDHTVAAALVRTQSASSARIAAQDHAAQVRIRTVYRNIVREVPTYVTPEAERRAVIPLGFVRLHDAAADGLSASGQGAGGADGGPGLAPTAPADVDADSGLKLSDVAATVSANYGTCYVWRQRLLDLQQWEAKREAIAGAKP